MLIYVTLNYSPILKSIYTIPKKKNEFANVEVHEYFLNILVPNSSILKTEHKKSFCILSPGRLYFQKTNRGELTNSPATNIV